MSILLSLLAARGLGALIGSVLVATQPGPRFADPRLLLAGDTIVISVQLQQGFNRNLDQVLISGSPVAIGYTVQLQTRDGEGNVLQAEPMTLVHSAAYDPATRSYAVYRSELGGRPDSVTVVATQPEAKELFTSLRAPLALRAVVPAGNEVSCRLEAALNTITLEAPDARELDLNAFWNYRYPRTVTPWLRPEGQ